jgi:hypothetical protein
MVPGSAASWVAFCVSMFVNRKSRRAGVVYCHGLREARDVRSWLRQKGTAPLRLNFIQSRKPSGDKHVQLAPVCSSDGFCPRATGIRILARDGRGVMRRFPQASSDVTAVLRCGWPAASEAAPARRADRRKVVPVLHKPI